MAERSYLRNDYGPRTVDSGPGHERGHGDSRRQREGGEKSHHRPKRDTTSRRSPKKESSHRRRHSPSRTDESSEKVSFELDVIGQPPRGVALGMPVETSVMLSLRLPSPDRSISAGMDTSRLFAVASLVADNRNGERVPLEAGIMTGQKMFDSLHSIPDDCAERLASNEPCRIALGYFSFSGLLVRQSGTYRIRTTLIRMGSSGTGGGTSISTVDSESIKVERRSLATARRPQRI